MLKVRRGNGGDFEVEIPPGLVDPLRTLPAKLRFLIERPDFSNKVVQRLFPPAYHDRERADEYRRLLGYELVQRKLEHLELFEESLAQCRRRWRGAKLVVPAKRFDAWLGALNDLRLLIGTELDITEDSWQAPVDEDDPKAESFMLFHVLSILEEALVYATGLLPEPPSGDDDKRR